MHFAPNFQKRIKRAAHLLDRLEYIAMATYICKYVLKYLFQTSVENTDTAHVIY